MQCLILAGGLGTRMKSVAGDLPKALLPVGEETFIDWQLKWLKLLGVREVIMALGYQSQAIERHIEARATGGLYPTMTYRTDGKEFLGTGGAVKNCTDLLNDDFLVTYGDSFLLLDAGRLFKAHLAAGRGLTLSILHNRNQGDKSNVLFKGGRVVAYDKVNRTPDMEHIDYGMLALNREWFLKHAPAGKFDLGDVLTPASRRGEVTAFLATEMFHEIGSPEGYRRFCEFMATESGGLQGLLKRVLAG